MAKKWYPVIDYLECAECGDCVDKCPHEVYDIKKLPFPLVNNPDACIDHCHFCGNKCPQGAITYVGDDTGWIPPNGSQQDNEPCCQCGCVSSCEDIPSVKKTLNIDFLFLDLKVCERCMGTDEVLIEAINEVRAVLKSAGYEVILNKIKIENEELAEQYKFVSSPTIRINGRDICLEVKENPCGSCSDLGCSSVDCRVFVYEGKDYEVPPKAMIINAILKAVYGQEQTQADNETYSLPVNLKNFFEGKRNNLSNCCGTNNCC